MDLMHVRLSAILELLQSGLNVWFTGAFIARVAQPASHSRTRLATDVDAVFNLDPFPFLSKKKYQAGPHPRR